MSKLEELIKEFCPNGVEYKRLSEVVVRISSGLNPRNNFRLNPTGATNFYVTVKEITKGKIIFNEKTDRIDDDALDIIQNRSHLEENDILLSGIGTIGKVAIVDIPTKNWNCSESVLLLKPKQSLILPKFLKYILESNGVQSYFNKVATGSTLRGIRMRDLQELQIPLPALPVQREIVRILDSFTLYSAELTAELTARRKQYEFYRDKLLKFDSGNIPRVKLKDIATEFYRGYGITREQVTKEGIPCVRYGEIYTIYNTWFDKCVSYTKVEDIASPKYFEYGDILFAITGESVEDIAKSAAYIGNEKCLAGGDIVVMKHKQNPKFLAYALSTFDARQQKSKGKIKSKVVHSNVPSIENIEIYLPPIDVQERIVKVLDNFDAICSDLGIGLPAEIEKRQKQYEYYRDKLLTFEGKNNNGEK